MRLALKVAATACLLSSQVSYTGQWISVQAAQPQATPVDSTPGASTAKAAAAVTPSAIRLTGHVEVDDRISILETLVHNGQVAGQLTALQSDNYLSALTQISQREAECIAIAGSVPPLIALQLQISLDQLERTIALSFHDRKLPTFDLGGRIAHITDRINSAEEEGRLSAENAASLKAELKASESLQMSGGKLDYPTVLRVSLALDKLIDHYAHVIQNRPFAIPDLKALAASDEQLEGKEAKDHLEELRQLSLKLNHPTPNLAALKKSMPASGEAAVSTAAQLEWWHMLLQQDLAGKLPALDLAAAQQQIDRSIAEGLDRGRLTPVEAQNMRARLDAVISPEQGTSSLEQKIGLALSLAKLQGAEKRSHHNPTRLWSGIDAMQASMDHRISDATKAGRLSAEQAAAIKAEADKIGQQESKYRATGMDAKQALEVVIALEQLNVRLHHELQDRQMATPDLDRLQSLLDRTVSQGVAQGQLDHSSKLVDKLNHVTQLKQAYAAAPGGLDARAKLAVAQEIQHHLSELHAEMHHDDSRAPEPLDTKLANLTRDIAASAASGILTVERATQYKAAVDTIYGQLLEAKKSGMTTAQSLAIANDIEALQDQYSDESREAATLPTQLAPRIKELAQRIGTQLADGRISLNEASELIQQVDRSAERLAAAASTEGGLSHGEGLRIAYDLESIANKMESDLNLDPVNIIDTAQFPALIDNKLGSALAAGRLSLPDAKRFSDAYEKIIDDSMNYRTSDRSLSYPESLALSVSWNQLNSTIDKALSKGAAGQDLDTRRMMLERRIKEAVAAGKVTRKDGQTVLDDLDRIAQSEANFRVSGEGLSFAEALTLSQDLDRQAARVNGLVKDKLSLKHKR